MLVCEQTPNKNVQLVNRPGENKTIERHKGCNISFVYSRAFWKSELNIASNLRKLFKTFTRKIATYYGHFLRSESQTYTKIYISFMGIRNCPQVCEYLKILQFTKKM